MKKKFDGEIVELLFVHEKTNFIFHVDKFINLKRLCISQSFIKKMFDIACNEGHLNFKRCYEIISRS